MSPELLTSIAIAVLIYGPVSKRGERRILTATTVFVEVGCLLGQAGFGFMSLDNEGSVIHRFAELTLVLVLFTDAPRIDISCLRREESWPIGLLGIGLPLTILAGGRVAAIVFPHFSLSECLLLAAILAPTDVAVGQPVASSPVIPVGIRQSLNVESGLNDGIVLPVVLLAASMAGTSQATADASSWLWFVLLHVTLGPTAGVAVDYFGGRLIALGIHRD